MTDKDHSLFMSQRGVGKKCWDYYFFDANVLRR